MPFSEKEVTLIMERMRGGESVTHSHLGGRYRSIWSYADGEWLLDQWEEGSGWLSKLSEAEMRASIAGAPEEVFLRMLGR